MPNRPKELYSILGKHAGEYIGFKRFEAFGDAYCQPYEVHCPYTGRSLGKNYDGCNEENFRKLMGRVKSKDYKDPKGFMLRQTKDILGLPKFSQSVILLSDDMPSELRSFDNLMKGRFSEQDLVKWQLAEKHSDDEFSLHVMKYRRLLGLHKVKSGVKHIIEHIENDENLLIGAYHIEVINELEKRLAKYDPFVISGKTPKNKRLAIVKEYQSSKRQRPLIGNYVTLGLGFNITRAKYIPMFEFSWSPTENMQFFERAWRIGVDHETHGTYLCFRNSLDNSTMRMVLKKDHLLTYV